MARLSFRNQWHNLYFAANALIWLGLVLLSAFFFRDSFAKTGILLGAAGAVSIVTSAVLIRPGHRLAGTVIQGGAWILLLGLSFLLYFEQVKVVLILFLPAAVLSMGLLLILDLLSLRMEKDLNEAMQRK